MTNISISLSEIDNRKLKELSGILTEHNKSKFISIVLHFILEKNIYEKFYPFCKELTKEKKQ